MGLFALGNCCATPGALLLCAEHQVNPLTLFKRHVCGDYGNLCVADVKANADAIAYGARILSKYVVGGEGLYLITEADRSVTTLLKCDEY